MRNVLEQAITKVGEHKSSGQASLGQFETQEQKDNFIATYAPTAIPSVRADFSTSVDGSPRIAGYTGAGMNVITRSSLGGNKIADELWASYVRDGSYVVHEGTENLIFDDGTVYHVPCTGGNTLDFEKYKKLLERRLAYLYIAATDLAGGNGQSTSAEIAAALADYTTFKGTIS